MYLGCVLPGARRRTRRGACGRGRDLGRLADGDETKGHRHDAPVTSNFAPSFTGGAGSCCTLYMLQDASSG